MVALLVRVATTLGALAGCLASQTIQASLVALQPLVLSQNLVGQVTHPAGPLTTASLQMGPSSLSVDLLPTTLGWSMESNLVCGFPPVMQNYYQADADLELTLSASAPMRVTLRVATHCQDDGGGFVSVDVPGHGSISFFNGSNQGERHLDHFQLDLTTTGLPITISQFAGGWPAGTSRLLIEVEAWSPLASPSAPACGGLFQHGPSSYPYYQFDHFVDLIDNGIASSSGTIRASGLGQWSSFLVGFSPALLPLQLPAPFAASCPVLANIAVATPGTVTDSVIIPSAWEVALPLLPPGMTIYAQHVCAKVPSGYPGNTLWNTSNVVRIDT